MSGELQEVTLDIVLPGVMETPREIEVRCGETVVFVHEVARADSKWCLWAGGLQVNNSASYSKIEGALQAAREYVKNKERSRRFYRQLEAKLASRGPA